MSAAALSAVIAVMGDPGLALLRRLDGRFTRSLLASTLWSRYDEAQQEAALSLMRERSLCFVHRPGVPKAGIGDEYILVDALPKEPPPDPRPRDAFTPYAVNDVTGLAPGFRRRVLCHVGTLAGIAADYWRTGVRGYEKGRRCHFAIQDRTQAHRFPIPDTSEVPAVEEPGLRLTVWPCGHKDFALQVNLLDELSAMVRALDPATPVSEPA